jgi:hypothetical protein
VVGGGGRGRAGAGGGGRGRGAARGVCETCETLLLSEPQLDRAPPNPALERNLSLGGK